MNAYVTTGLFLSMAIHTSALLLFNQHALQRMDALPEARALPSNCPPSRHHSKNKRTNFFFRKALDKDLSEKRRPENSDLQRGPIM